MVQWLRLRASTAGSTGSVPGWRTKILHARGQNKMPKKNAKKKKNLKFIEAVIKP